MVPKRRVRGRTMPRVRARLPTAASLPLSRGRLGLCNDAIVRVQQHRCAVAMANTALACPIAAPSPHRRRSLRQTVIWKPKKFYNNGILSYIPGIFPTYDDIQYISSIYLVYTCHMAGESYAWYYQVYDICHHDIDVI
jgi:hypothetical protein